MPSPKRLDAGFESARDETFDAFVMLRGDEWSDASRLLARIADRHLRSGRTELRQELIGDFRIGKDARAGETDLARVEVLSRRGLRCGVEVGVRAYDERRLAAELEAHRGQRASRRGADQLRRIGRAGETQTIDVGMRRERCTRLFADSLHNVEHACWNAGLRGKIGHHRAGQRRPLGRLDDSGIAGGETWTYLPGGQHERPVPWRDERSNTCRIEAHMI